MANKRTARAQAVEAALGESGSGKQQVAVRFRLLDDPGKYLTWYGFFTDAAFDITVRGLRACGWGGDDLSNLDGVTRNEVELVVEDEIWEEKERTKVQFVNPVGGGALALKKALAPDQAKAFAAQMKGKVLQFNKSAGAPRTDATSFPPKEDDVP